MMWLSKKVSKSTVWIFFCIIGLPLLVTGIKVWSRQESDTLRYVEKEDFNPIKEKQAVLASKLSSIEKKINDIQDGQKETQKEIRQTQEDTQKDIKEILKYLRGKTK